MARMTGPEKKKTFDRVWGSGVVKPCHYCGVGLTQDTATLDHIVPLSRRKGSNEVENLIICCGPCNSEKGTMRYEAFKALKLPEKQARKAAAKHSVFSKPWA